MIQVSTSNDSSKFLAVFLMLSLILLGAALYLFVFPENSSQNVEFSVSEISENRTVVEQTKGNVDGGLEIVLSVEGNTYSSSYTPQEVKGNSEFEVSNKNIESVEDISVVSIYVTVDEGKKRLRKLDAIGIGNIKE